MGIFIKIGSFGAFFIITLLIFITSVGILGFTNTEYKIGSAADAMETIWTDPGSPRTIVLFNANFSPIAGILCAGYFLHTCSTPIMRSAKNPENNIRDLFISYTLVFMSYVIVGGFGYIGFTGTFFDGYYANLTGKKVGQIDQNCLNMFDYTNIPAFILRLAIFFLLFTTYPLINHFLRNLLLNLFWRNKTISKTGELILNVSLAVIPLLCALFYPNVGTVLSYAGALSGFVIIYCLPVMVHLKQRRL